MSEEAKLDEFVDNDEPDNRHDSNSKWDRASLEEIAEWITAGGTPRTSNENYWSGSIPWVQTGELTKRHIASTEKHITEAGLKNSSAKRFPAGTLLIGMYGEPTVGESALLEIEATTNQACCGVFPNKDVINAEFLHQMMQYEKPRLYSLRAGSGQQNIRQGIIRRFKIDIPSLEEQRKIASVLYNVDQAILKTDEIIEQTNCIRQEYIRERITDQKSDTERKEGIVGTRRVTVPAYWSTTRLGDVARIVSGKSFPRDYQQGHAGPRAVIKVEDMNLPDNGKYIKNVTNRVTDDVVSELNKNIFPGDTVIHPRVGEALLLNKTRITTEDAAFDDNIMGWIPEGIDPEYLYYASTLVDFNAVAQTGTVPSINKEMAANFRFPLPPEDEQEEIAEDLSRIDGQISIYEQEKNHLKRLKQGLMQDLLSGKVRTTDRNIPVLPQVAEHG